MPSNWWSWGEEWASYSSLMAPLFLECFQYQHLSLVVPGYFSSHPIFVVFPAIYLSLSIFQCHLVNLLAFPSNHLVAVVTSSSIQDWATPYYLCPVGVSI